MINASRRPFRKFSTEFEYSAAAIRRKSRPPHRYSESQVHTLVARSPTGEFFVMMPRGEIFAIMQRSEETRLESSH